MRFDSIWRLAGIGRTSPDPDAPGGRVARYREQQVGDPLSIFGDWFWVCLSTGDRPSETVLPVVDEDSFRILDVENSEASGLMGRTFPEQAIRSLSDANFLCCRRFPWH
jgi:hypothetical protein